MTGSPRVFLLEPVKFNTKAAQAHGEIVYLFDAHNAPGPLQGQDALEKIVQRLFTLHFQPHDFIALTGTLPLVTMLVLAASELSDSSAVNILVFDARDCEYKHRMLNPSKVAL